LLTHKNKRLVEVFLENFSLNFVLQSSFVKEPGDLKWKLFSQSGKNLFSSTKELHEAKVVKIRENPEETLN